MRERSQPSRARFATTHWSVVLTAQDTGSSDCDQALTTLCQTYWFPLYAYLRRKGFDRHQAEDYTQAFLTRLLEKKYLRQVEPERGRFRSFLLGALRHFVANELDRAHAKKRGGAHTLVSLDIQTAEGRYSREPADTMSPERLFERSWALTVLNRAMDELQAEATSAKKRRIFSALKDCLTLAQDAVPYGDLAAELQMTEGAVRVAMHRLRKRYRELLRAEIAQTVAGADQVEDEIRDLFGALSG